MFQKSNQLEKGFGLEPTGREAERFMNRRISPIRPLARYAETAALAFAQNQRVYACYAPLLEYFKAMAPTRMKRMTDLRPSQIRTALKCSLH